MKHYALIFSRRIGTAFGGWLSGVGVTGSDADVLVAAVPVLFGLAVDAAHSEIAQRMGWKK